MIYPELIDELDWTLNKKEMIQLLDGIVERLTHIKKEILEQEESRLSAVGNKISECFDACNRISIPLHQLWIEDRKLKNEERKV